MFYAIGLSLIPYGIMVGAQPVLITECFRDRFRYSGSSLAYHLGAIIAGSVQPLFGWIFVEYKSGEVLAVLVLASALVSLFAVALLQHLRRPTAFRRPVVTASGSSEAALPGKSRSPRSRLVLWIAKWLAPGPAGDLLPGEAARGPKRNLNAWIDNPSPNAGCPFHISVNVGAQTKRLVASAEFAEPDWLHRESIDLIISLSSLDCEVNPAWSKVVLPRTGNSETVKFKVVAAGGRHKFSLRVYLAKPMILAQSLSFFVLVKPAQMETTGAHT
jgi:hypothetical protein